MKIEKRYFYKIKGKTEKGIAVCTSFYSDEILALKDFIAKYPRFKGSASILKVRHIKNMKISKGYIQDGKERIINYFDSTDSIKGWV